MCGIVGDSNKHFCHLESEPLEWNTQLKPSRFIRPFLIFRDILWYYRKSNPAIRTSVCNFLIAVDSQSPCARRDAGREKRFKKGGAPRVFSHGNSFLAWSQASSNLEITFCCLPRAGHEPRSGTRRDKIISRGNSSQRAGQRKWKIIAGHQGSGGSSLNPCVTPSKLIFRTNKTFGFDPGGVNVYSKGLTYTEESSDVRVKRPMTFANSGSVKRNPRSGWPNVKGVLNERQQRRGKLWNHTCMF